MIKVNLVAVMGIVALILVGLRGTAGADGVDNPLGGLTPLDDGAWFTGVVEEVVDAGPYYYAFVRREAGSTWVVAVGDGYPVGALVSVGPFGRKEAFASRRTGRVFESVLFARVHLVEESDGVGTPLGR